MKLFDHYEGGGAGTASLNNTLASSSSTSNSSSVGINSYSDENNPIRLVWLWVRSAAIKSQGKSWKESPLSSKQQQQDECKRRKKLVEKEPNSNQETRITSIVSSLSKYLSDLTPTNGHENNDIENLVANFNVAGKIKDKTNMNHLLHVTSKIAVIVSRVVMHHIRGQMSIHNKNTLHFMPNQNYFSKIGTLIIKANQKFLCSG